jgi:hypothetical protein
MKPKNSKERRLSFLKFLGLFVLTSVMIVAAVFANYNVPQKENALLRENSKVVKAEMDFQSNFFDEMQDVKSLIDSLDVPGQNTNFLKSQINDKLVDLQKTIPTRDSTYLYEMHSSIVNLYVELAAAKDKLHELKDAEGTIEEYREAYEDCSRELKAAERELRIR